MLVYSIKYSIAKNLTMLLYSSFGRMQLMRNVFIIPVYLLYNTFSNVDIVSFFKTNSILLIYYSTLLIHSFKGTVQRDLRIAIHNLEEMLAFLSLP